MGEDGDLEGGFGQGLDDGGTDGTSGLRLYGQHVRLARREVAAYTDEYDLLDLGHFG